MLWKESLKNDGQQFHQYQPSKQSPFTSIKNIVTYDVRNQKWGEGGKPVNMIPIILCIYSIQSKGQPYNVSPPREFKVTWDTGLILKMYIRLQIKPNSVR